MINRDNNNRNHDLSPLRRYPGVTLENQMAKALTVRAIEALKTPDVAKRSPTVACRVFTWSFSLPE